MTNEPFTAPSSTSPASPRPLRWTERQNERLLWAPQDDQEHLQKVRRTPGRNGRR